MAKAKTLVGLDVHATKIVAAVLDAETGELQTFARSGESATAAGFFRFGFSSGASAVAACVTRKPISFMSFGSCFRRLLLEGLGIAQNDSRGLTPERRPTPEGCR